MMNDTLLLICTAFLIVMYFLYWLLIFLLTDTIFDEQKLKKPYRIPIAMANTGLIFTLSTLEGGSLYSYGAIFALLLVDFYFLYKDMFGKILFCASACIIHVMALRAMVTAALSLVTGYSVYDVSNEAGLCLLSVSAAAAITNLATIGVLKFIPTDKIKIINQRKEQQWFMIAWMTVFNLYLLCNANVFRQQAFHPSLTGNELIAPSAILLGLYIVLFFAFKTATLLGYKEKNAELQLAVYQEQQYRNSATRDAIMTYEINVTKDMIIKGFEENAEELAELANRYSDILSFMTHRFIYSEDIEKFVQYATRSNIMREYEEGKSETNMEYRRLHKNGKYIWVRAVTNLVKDMENGDLIAFVCIKNIEAEKQHQLKLQYKAERDPLTGLYNKEMTGKLINEKLTYNQYHTNSALFMIDVDDFKEINDHYGHVYGDAVLCELADKLRHVFRADDIIGRIGGDEYMAFMKDGANAKIVDGKAEEICKAFYTVFNGQNEEKYIVSSSIGISLSPQDGRNFEELYHHADIALYEAKSKGKNTHAFYDGKSFTGYQSNRTEIQSIGAIPPRSFRQNRIEYVFKILYQSDNPVAAIHSALELVTSHFSFERGYIFETSKDGKTTSNTFEWCAEDVTPQMGALQNLPMEVVANANSDFRKGGTFILRNLDDLRPFEREVLEPQGIKSMFQFGIFDNNNLLGFIGFDNCKKESMPSDIEIDEMTTICNILATFFVKQRIAEESTKSLGALTEVMNRLENYIYVINPESFEVLFMNEKTRRLMKNDNNSEPCYSFFRGNNCQCDDCPIRNLTDDPQEKSVLEIYNEKLHVWIETSATPLRWSDGSTGYFINCLDITKQKKEHRQHIRQLERLAYVDELTGSRTYYKFRLDAQRILEEQPSSLHLMVKLDIDNFKLINGLYGYEKGNEVLRKVARAIELTLRGEQDIFARRGNDEFIALLQIQNAAEATELHHAFLSNFFSLVGDEFAFKFNFPHGRYVVQLGEIEESDIMDMFEKVNLAHKAAKQDKSRQFAYYDESLTAEVLEQKEIENKMEKALLNEEFVVYLQPKYYLEGERMGGAEALVRWKTPSGALRPPSDFIPVFERNGFIVKLDLYMFEKVCGIIKGWVTEGLTPVTVSVNFSRLHLSNRDFVKELNRIAASYGIDRKYIELEITETAIYDNIDALETLLAELHESQFTMSMDDFGSGYSSLSMLKNLPVDVIKMDRSFFVNQKDANRSKIIVGSVIEMAAKLGICIVAEGVEEKEHIEFLRDLHCDMIQGYYFAKPVPADDFSATLKQQKEIESGQYS